jgi:selenocysteine lyase/cysteine desulfurase
MDASRTHELGLIPTVIDGLCSIPGLRLFGISDPGRSSERCSTFAFTLAGHHPTDIARFLADRAIWVWDGNYYAYELIRALGLDASGGMVRVGFVHYNTAREVERLVSALDELAGH